MKTIIVTLFTLISVLAFAQKPIIDTAQVVIANRENTAESETKPYVILISTDGFRYDYAQKYNAENLLKLAASGVQAKSMYPSFPSITFPNHWSLITGLYPAHHGLIDNNFYDYQRKESYALKSQKNAEDGSWYGGEPLWSLAEKQGLVSATMHWVGSASDAGSKRPTYYYHYHEAFSPEQKVEKVINWLKLPEKTRPHFITLYFPEVDHAGHTYGPDAIQTKNAVHLIDNAIGSLVDKVNQLGLKDVNYVFVSDHGMIQSDFEKPLEIPALLLDKSKFDIYNNHTSVRVFVKDLAEVKSTYHALKKQKTKDYEVYLTKKLPRKLHFATRDDKYSRIGQIILLPNAPKIFLEAGRKTYPGKHGYNPFTTPEMQSTFFAWGPEFKPHISIKSFNNVNVYPMIAEILGLKINQPIDGKAKVLQPILKTK